MAGETFVRGAALEEEIGATYRALIGSMDLPPDLAARIREIIARSASARADLARQAGERPAVPAGDKPAVVPVMWARAMLLNAERDAAIRSMLIVPAHQRAFEANAAAMQRQLDAIRPGTTT